jgi:phage shock protein PspC (stress-responsive transcriptional regulator)
MNWSGVQIPLGPQKTYKMEEKTKMYRPKIDRVIGGVCSGLAYNLNIEPLILRILSVGLIFTPLPIILIYILLWVFIPGEKEE